jgi:uncharacterized Zn finger protein (UPF0148 family)
MICAHCHIPNFIETASGLCPQCARAERDATQRRREEERATRAVKIAQRMARADALGQVEAWRDQLERGRVSYVIERMGEVLGE